MNKVKHMKKVTSFLLLIVTALLLVACSPKENVPYGSLTDEKYLSVGNVTITEKELYQNLRRESDSVLSNMITEEVFAEYLGEANTLLAVVGAEEESTAHIVQKMFDDNINTKLFGTKDLDVIRLFPEVNHAIAIETFVNNLYQSNYNIDRGLLKAALTNKLNNLDDEEFKPEYYTIEVLKNIFIIDIQKYLYSKDQLEIDIKDEDSSAFVSKNNVITHYKNEVKSHHDVQVFYFHFKDLATANAALRAVNMKPSQTGYYFNVLDIRDQVSYEQNKDEPIVKQALEDSGLDKFFENYPNDFPEIDELRFKQYYDKYKVNDLNAEQRLDNAEVLNRFVAMYNYSRVLSNGSNGLVVDNYHQNTTVFDGLEIKYTKTDNNGENIIYETNKTYKELADVGAAFAKYIYTELSEEKPYSTVQSAGGRRYLAFKLSNDVVEFDFVSETKDEDDNEKWVTVEELQELLTSESQEVKDRVIAELESLLNKAIDINNIDWEEIQEAIDTNIETWEKEVAKKKLTTAYTNRVVNELLEEAKIEIYDEFVKRYFNRNYDAKGSNKKGDTLAKITIEILGEKKVYEIKVDDFYAKLEQENGLELALDLAMNRILLKEYNAGKNGIFAQYLDEVKIKDLKNEYKQLIKRFSNDEFAQMGYPASMGRESFLLFLLGSSNKDEAFELGYVIPKLREIFFTNIDLSLPELSEEEFYQNLYKYTNKQYENYKGVSVHHLLFYFDADGNGTPDKPAEYFEKLDTTEKELILDQIIFIYNNLLLEIAKKAKGGNTGAVTLDEYKKVINDFINDYNNVSEVILEDGKDSVYREAKRLGIQLKFEDLSSPITNSSNLPYNEGTLDTVFYDRAMALYEQIMTARENAETNEETLLGNNGLIHFDFAGSLNVVDDIDGLTHENLDHVMSDFGFHFILVDDIVERASAKYEKTATNADDFTFEDEDGNVYEIFNDTDQLTVEQIKYYVIGKKTNEDVPNVLNKAFNQYFVPIHKLFESSNMKQAIFFNYIKSIDGFNLHGKDARFAALEEINETLFYNYMNKTSPDFENFGTQYQAWKDLYDGWFEDFKLN